MMRSLYSGVSGLQNHQVRMDVLGNNIANVNTTGFKKGRVNFQDMLYQQLSGAAKPNEMLGGVNAKEVGLGMSVASIDTIHTQGTLQTTGVITDVAIQGAGFFVLKAGDKSYYTRAGDFSLDKNGLLVNPANGMKVQGWNARILNGQDFVNVSAGIEDLVIPVGSKDPARATSSVDFACNLSKLTPEIPADTTDPATIQRGTWQTDVSIYDDFGRKHTMRINFTRVVGQPNQWTGTLAIDPESTFASNASVGLAAAPAGVGTTFTVEFDNQGRLYRLVDAAGQASATEGRLSLRVGYDVEGTAEGRPGLQRQEFSINLGTVGSQVDTITQFAQDSSFKGIRQDGYGMGYLESFKIDQSGQITGVYSNGSNRLLGQIALASFANPGGLEKAGETTFVVSNNSGDPNIGASGTAGKGKIIAGVLEMSNVDLAEQFTDMIVTQRGFQASSKTIQTSDQMLQELLTLKR